MFSFCTAFLITIVYIAAKQTLSLAYSARVRAGVKDSSGTYWRELNMNNNVTSTLLSIRIGKIALAETMRGRCGLRKNACIPIEVLGSKTGNNVRAHCAVMYSLQ
jgi:hypothetical protein